jgi:hypothetical protein
MVSSETWLIDDRGRFWSDGDRRLGLYLQSRSDPETLWDYAIRNLGCVSVGRSANVTRVRLRARVVSATTLTTLLYWVLDRPTPTTVLTQWDAGWRDEITGDTTRLVHKLCALQAVAAGPPTNVFERQTLEPLSLAARDPLRVFYALLSNAYCQSEQEVAESCDRLFGGTFTIVRRNLDGTHAITRQGLGYKIYSKAYLAKAVGTRIEDDPNQDYGRWTAQGLCDAAAQPQPIVERVTALLDGPAGRRHVSYSRIIAQVTSDNGLPGLVTASRINSLGPLYGKAA